MTEQPEIKFGNLANGSPYIDQEARRAEGQHKIDRTVTQPLRDILALIGDLAGGREFECDMFIYRPYNWNGYFCYEDVKVPNFEMKENNFGWSGLKIAWYKYPLRGAYSNFSINAEDAKAITWICIRGLIEAFADTLAENKTMKEALAFYALVGNWQGCKNGFDESQCDRDIGNIARQAIGRVTVDTPGAERPQINDAKVR